MNKKLKRECKLAYKQYADEFYALEQVSLSTDMKDAFEEGFKAAMKIFTQKIDDTFNEMEK